MTAQQMSDQIVEAVNTGRKGVGLSVADVMQSCGPEARGDRALEFKPNLLLWDGGSELFAEAMRLALPHIKMRVLPPILVLGESHRLALPVAKHIQPYKRPRWLPVALLPMKAA